MKQPIFRGRLLAAGIVFLFLAVAAGAQPPAADSPQKLPLTAPVRQEFTFKPDTSKISYFLKGNVHDTLGFVQKITGTASATLAGDGRLTAAAVQFSFAADAMDSKDAKRDERMKKKFMEISLYPEVSFRGAAAPAGLQAAGPVARATKDKPLAFDLEGSLTIHGATKQLSIPVTVYPQSNLLITEGSTILLLQDFNIANPSVFIFRTEDTVRVEFHIELQPAGGAAS